MKRQVCSLTLSLFLSFVSFNTEAQEPASSISKEEFKKILIEVLQENPELIANTKDHVQKKLDFRNSKKLEKQLVKKHMARILSTEGYPIIGNPLGDQKVIAFFDPQCAYCHQMIKDMLGIIARHPNLQIVVRDMPFLGDLSDLLSRLHILSYQQGRFPELLNELFAVTTNLNQSQAEEIARKVGMQLDASAEVMEKIKHSIEESKSLATALKIDSVPTFIIGNRIYRDYHGLESFERLVKKSFLSQNEKP
ncbi:MAG: hypothetical protein BGO28_07110 [Alphaproteobacteria bacterium 43-37]|nr:MAG: hypothetical protein BGO28_07110 [Alphaproteobacteria bacterium 43-37]